MEIHQDTHSFHHSCTRVRHNMLGLGKDSWAFGDGECSLAPSGGSVAYHTCSKIVRTTVMENDYHLVIQDAANLGPMLVAKR